MSEDEPANLQSKGMTVKQAAAMLNISERTVYMARKVHRLRPDLAVKVLAGEMSLNEAHHIATGARKPTSWDRLVSAWNAATDEDRARLINEATDPKAE